MLARARQNLQKIAAMLQDLVQDIDESPSEQPRCMRAYHLVCAQEELKRQVARRAIFGRYGLLEDPTWDALVRIFSAEMQGNPISLRELLKQIGASEELSMRWLNLLGRMDLVEFESSPHKNDEIKLRMTQYTAAMMTEYFQCYYPQSGD